MTEQLVVFKLGAEEYATSIAKVKEIIRYGGVTKIPGTPEYMEGIINLRGKVIPVFDLATKFAMTVNPTVNRQAVIVEAAGREIGVLVDVVNEVLTIDESAIELGSSMIRNNQIIRGIGKVENRLIILLDLDKLFFVDEMEYLNAC